MSCLAAARPSRPPPPLGAGLDGPPLKEGGRAPQWLITSASCAARRGRGVPPAQATGALGAPDAARRPTACLRLSCAPRRLEPALGGELQAGLRPGRPCPLRPSPKRPCGPLRAGRRLPLCARYARGVSPRSCAPASLGSAPPWSVTARGASAVPVPLACLRLGFLQNLSGVALPLPPHGGHAVPAPPCGGAQRAAPLTGAGTWPTGRKCDALRGVGPGRGRAWGGGFVRQKTPHQQDPASWPA